MSNKTPIIICILLILAFSPLLSIQVSADDDINVNIHMIEEETRNLFGKPVIIAGIWHFINVTTDSQDLQELNLKLYSGSTAPDEENRDETNYYEWKYDTNSQQWIDVKEYDGYTYINDSICKKTNNIYSFCIGVNPNILSEGVDYENWTLDVYKDENSIYSESVVIEISKVGLAKTHGDEIIFNVSPFVEMEALGNDYFAVKNSGNIPIFVTVDYGSYYNDIIDITDLATKLIPGETSTYNIKLYSESWKPETKQITGTISGKIPDSYIITTAPFTFPTSPGINAPDLKIYIGHANYRIDPNILDSYITFQYVESLEMAEGEIKDIKAYISGDGNVKLGFRGVNLTIKKVFSENAETSSPISITSTNTSEHTVTVKVEALRENSIAYLYYDLEIDGNIRTYFTEITVGPPSESSSEGTTLDITLIMAILLIIFLVIGYMMYTHRKYRRR